jgi:ankyrin repeat protein
LAWEIFDKDVSIDKRLCQPEICRPLQFSWPYFTPLMSEQSARFSISVASEHGHANSVEQLLNTTDDEARGLVGKVNNFKRTALHSAAEGGHTEVIDGHLMRMDLQKVKERDKMGQSALHLAAGSGSVEVVDLLLEFATAAVKGAKASASAKAKHHKKTIKTADVAKAKAAKAAEAATRKAKKAETHADSLLSALDNKRWTALHCAARGTKHAPNTNYPRVIRRLLKAGIDPKLKSSS